MRLNLKEIAEQVERYRQAQEFVIERAQLHRFRGFSLKDLGLETRDPTPLAETWGQPSVELRFELYWTDGDKSPFQLVLLIELAEPLEPLKALSILSLRVLPSKIR